MKYTITVKDEIVPLLERLAEGRINLTRVKTNVK